MKPRMVWSMIKQRIECVTSWKTHFLSDSLERDKKNYLFEYVSVLKIFDDRDQIALLFRFFRQTSSSSDIVIKFNQRFCWIQSIGWKDGLLIIIRYLIPPHDLNSLVTCRKVDNLWRRWDSWHCWDTTRYQRCFWIACYHDTITGWGQFGTKSQSDFSWTLQGEWGLWSVVSSESYHCRRFTNTGIILVISHSTSSSRPGRRSTQTQSILSGRKWRVRKSKLYFKIKFHSEKGCETFFNDDVMHTSRGLFHYTEKHFLNGFKTKPTDHYYRPYYAHLYKVTYFYLKERLVATIKLLQKLRNLWKLCWDGRLMSEEFMMPWFLSLQKLGRSILMKIGQNIQH